MNEEVEEEVLMIIEIDENVIFEKAEERLISRKKVKLIVNENNFLIITESCHC
jgi:hypothetical protein